MLSWNNKIIHTNNNFKIYRLKFMIIENQFNTRKCMKINNNMEVINLPKFLNKNNNQFVLQFKLITNDKETTFSIKILTPLNRLILQNKCIITKPIPKITFSDNLMLRLMKSHMVFPINLKEFKIHRNR